MYTKVNRIECIACGLCQLKAPEIFDYDAEGIAFSKLDANHGQVAIPIEAMAHFKAACQNCPTGAIKRQTQPFN